MQSLDCFNNLELHSEGSRESGFSCWQKAVTGHPEHVTDEGPKIMGSKSNCSFEEVRPREKGAESPGTSAQSKGDLLAHSLHWEILAQAALAKQGGSP